MFFLETSWRWAGLTADGRAERRKRNHQPASKRTRSPILDEARRRLVNFSLASPTWKASWIPALRSNLPVRRQNRNQVPDTCILSLSFIGTPASPIRRGFMSSATPKSHRTASKVGGDIVDVNNAFHRRHDCRGCGHFRARRTTPRRASAGQATRRSYR